MLAEATLFLALAGTPAPHVKPPPVPQYRINYVKKQLLKKGLTQDEVDILFNDKRLLTRMEPTIASPDCAPVTWEELETNMMSDESILRGKEFLENNSVALRKAETERCVAPQYIVAVIRIETDLGKCLGNFSAFNVLYHNLVWIRWRSQASNLVALAVYCKEIGRRDCLEVPGSSAGAIGLSQFMPISLRFAEDGDGDGDGIKDLFNRADAIMSTANFLKKHGWRRNKEMSLRSYYGTGGSYVRITLKYAKKLKEK
ncbi:MAG: lytic murein transglycosylase [Patescibacteria group bacterium]